MASYPSLLRFLGNKALDAYGHWRSSRYDARQSISVFCTGRGGSTWLAQVLASPPRHHILWEPLHWKSDREARAKGFGEPRYIRRGDRASRARNHVEGVLRGQTLSSFINSQRYFRPWHLLRIRAYVVKFVTANMMLPWMADVFRLRAVHLVRHPCAVVSSQLIHGAWDDIDKSFCHHPELFRDAPHLQDIHERISSTLEILAFNWGIQNWVPLTADNGTEWITTTYEDMVEDGIGEITRIFDFLGEPLPEDIHKWLEKPSATTVSQSSVAQGENRLTGWKKRLSSEDVERILSITQAVGVTGYTDDLRPSLPLAISPKEY